MLCSIRSSLELLGTLTTPLCSQVLSENLETSFKFCEIDHTEGARRVAVAYVHVRPTSPSRPCQGGNGKSTSSSSLKGNVMMPSLTSGSTSRSHCYSNASSTARNDKAFFKPIGTMQRAIPFNTDVKRDTISTKGRSGHHDATKVVHTVPFHPTQFSTSQSVVIHMFDRQKCWYPLAGTIIPVRLPPCRKSTPEARVISIFSRGFDQFLVRAPIVVQGFHSASTGIALTAAIRSHNRVWSVFTCPLCLVTTVCVCDNHKSTCCFHPTGCGHI